MLWVQILPSSLASIVAVSPLSLGFPSKTALCHPSLQYGILPGHGSCPLQEAPSHAPEVPTHPDTELGRVLVPVNPGESRPALGLSLVIWEMGMTTGFGRTEECPGSIPACTHVDLREGSFKPTSVTLCGVGQGLKTWRTRCGACTVKSWVGRKVQSQSKAGFL